MALVEVHACVLHLAVLAVRCRSDIDELEAFDGVRLTDQGYQGHWATVPAYMVVV